MRDLEKLYEDAGFWQINPVRMMVKPFPGKFPTRWRVRLCTSHGKWITDRVTKPNRDQMLRIIDRARHLDGVIELTEFDRLGAFRSLCRHTPREEFGIQKHAGSIAYFYYPWHQTSDFFGPWYNQVFHKEMQMNKTHFFIYSPYEKMGVDEALIQKLRDYKTWLRKANPWK